MSKPAPPLPKAIFFDLDGTLLDSLPGIAYSMERAFASCSLPMRPADLHRIIDSPIRSTLARAAQNPTPTQLDRLELAFRHSYDTEGWQKTLPFAGSTPMLRDARALGIHLFIVSNKPRHISLRVLNREGILALFSEVVTGDSTTPHYPTKADMIAYLLGQFHLDPSRTMMVGDTAEDAHAAAAMLVPFTLMTHGYGDVPAASPVPVALRIHTFAELLPALQKQKETPQ